MRCIACNAVLDIINDTIFDELLELCNTCYFSYTEATEDFDNNDE